MRIHSPLSSRDFEGILACASSKYIVAQCWHRRHIVADESVLAVNPTLHGRPGSPLSFVPVASKDRRALGPRMVDRLLAVVLTSEVRQAVASLCASIERGGRLASSP